MIVCMFDVAKLRGSATRFSWVCYDAGLYVGVVVFCRGS